MHARPADLIACCWQAVTVEEDTIDRVHTSGIRLAGRAPQAGRRRSIVEDVAQVAAAALAADLGARQEWDRFVLRLVDGARQRFKEGRPAAMREILRSSTMFALVHSGSDKVCWTLQLCCHIRKLASPS